MKRCRLLSAFLSGLLLVSFAAGPAAAAEENPWLLTAVKDAPAFTDIGAQSWCADAVDTVYRVGLMSGKTPSHFAPENSLTGVQSIVILARLHLLLTGDALDDIPPEETDWWAPYAYYLERRVLPLGEHPAYVSLLISPDTGCCRDTFLTLLSLVLSDSGVALPEINTVSAVPDCQDEELLAFYRWGIINGKDAYGTLEGSAVLSRGAAAAILARLIDPAQRLTLHLKPLELCQELLNTDPQTPLMTIGGETITAELFVPTLVSVCSSYNHSHFAAMTLEMSGGNVVDETVRTLQDYVLCRNLARERKIELSSQETAYETGYRGLTAQGQSWTQQSQAALEAVSAAMGDAFSQEPLPEVVYAPAWQALSLSQISTAVAALPYWGGHF